MKDIEVKGHSGCQIEVKQEGRTNYLYKYTKDPKYFGRLVRQGEKQQAMHNMENLHICVPQIYEIEQHETIVILKMQYVYSKNFVEFFELAGFEQILALINALCNFVESEIQQCEIANISKQVFIDKFDEIHQKCKINELCCNDNRIESILKQAQEVFSNLDVMKLPVGMCHGDLTFSNLLFSGNNYYLIDFLDSFIETPLQDIVKIRQDTQHNWSPLMYAKPYDNIRMSIIFKKIDQEIDSYFNKKYLWYTNYYNIMQLMNLLRILPYVKEKKVLSFLELELSRVINEF